MQALPALLLSGLFILPLRAAPVELGTVKLRDGRTLEKVIVMKVEQDGLRVEHRAGAGKIRMVDLPSNLAERFSPDTRGKEPGSAPASGAPKEEKSPSEAERAAQDSQVRQERIAIFDQIKAESNYAAVDGQLLQKIKDWKDAGRDDLATLFEEDRVLLKQQEITRSSGTKSEEKESMAERLSKLQSEVSAVNQRLQYPSHYSTPSYRYRTYYYRTYPNYYYTQPSYYYVPGPVINYCPPTVSRPNPVFNAPSSPRPVNSGNPIHGSHLWKK